MSRIIFSTFIVTYLLVWKIPPLIVAATAHSAHLHCQSDYMGNIYFNFRLGCFDALKCARLFYRAENRRTKSDWIEETECKYNDNKSLFSCKMHQLTKREKFGFDDENEYFFMLTTPLKSQSNSRNRSERIGSNTIHHSRISRSNFTSRVNYTLDSNTTTFNSILSNITDIRFKEDNTLVAPWSTAIKFIYCSNAVGVKYFNVISSATNITVHMIRHALDVQYGNLLSDIRLTFVGSGFTHAQTINKEKHCNATSKDFCSFTHQSVKSCTDFQVCVSGYYKNELNQRICKTVRTLGCGKASWNTVKWLYRLVIAFSFTGVLILMTFYTVFKIKTRCTPRHVSDDDYIEPRFHHVNQFDVQHENHSMLPAGIEDHIYDYPVISPMHKTFISSEEV